MQLETINKVRINKVLLLPLSHEKGSSCLRIVVWGNLILALVENKGLDGWTEAFYGTSVYRRTQLVAVIAVVPATRSKIIVDVYI